MIFITVGTANKGFDRLIETCDQIAKKNNLDFFAQIGSTSYTPKYMVFERWLSQQEIENKYNSASAFITHGGFGTLSECLRKNKPIIVVPRGFDNNEAVNDQSDISQKLDKLHYVKCILNLEDLEHAILNITHIPLRKYDLVTDIPSIIRQKVKLFSEIKK